MAIILKYCKKSQVRISVCFFVCYALTLHRRCEWYIKGHKVLSYRKNAVFEGQRNNATEIGGKASTVFFQEIYRFSWNIVRKLFNNSLRCNQKEKNKGKTITPQHKLSRRYLYDVRCQCQFCLKIMYFAMKINDIINHFAHKLPHFLFYQ